MSFQQPPVSFVVGYCEITTTVQGVYSSELTTVSHFYIGFFSISWC